MGKIHLWSLTFATKIALVPIFCGRQKHYELDVFRHIESPPSFDPKLERPKMHLFPSFRKILMEGVCQCKYCQLTSNVGIIIKGLRYLRGIVCN